MSDKIRVLIVDDLPETRENVRKLLQFESDVEVIAQAGNGEQAVEMAKQHRPDIILMDINMPGLDGIAASQAIVRSVPSAQIVIMSVQSEADYLRRAMLAGARDFLMKPFSGDELISAIRRVHEMRPSGAESGPVSQQPSRSEAVDRLKPVAEEGQVISVYSPKGGIGCSTIAVNLAVALANKGHRTLLIDGSLQFGDVSVMLNMKPATSILDLIERIEDLDEDLISSVVMKHKKSDLNVLLAPPRPEMADLVTDQHTRKLLGKLRHMFEFVIIDTSASLNDVALAMLDLSDRIYLVTQQNLPSLKNVSRFFDLAETLNYDRDKVALVVNRASKRLGISVKDISDTLKRPVLATIPVDDEVAGQAIDQGQPLVLGKHKTRAISNSLNHLATLTIKELAPRADQKSAAEEPAKRSFWSRLFGWRSPATGSS